MLLSQLGLITNLNSHWIFDAEVERIELLNSEDGETEEKEIFDPFQLNQSNTRGNGTNKAIAISCSENAHSLHHPEIKTPPPKQLLF